MDFVLVFNGFRGAGIKFRQLLYVDLHHGYYFNFIYIFFTLLQNLNLYRKIHNFL